MYEWNKKKLSSPQIKMALRVASAYYIVSSVVIMVITGIIPIHQLALEKSEVEQARKNGNNLVTTKLEARRKALSTWQREWDAAARGR